MLSNNKIAYITLIDFYSDGIPEPHHGTDCSVMAGRVLPTFLVFERNIPGLNSQHVIPDD